MRTRWWGLGVPALFALACGWDPFASCDEACAQSGRCGERTWATGDGFLRCFPRGDADCEQSRDCAERGLCDYRPERELEACIAATEASCVASADCPAEGRCRTDYSGRCRTSEAGCVASRACATEDRCKSLADHCVVPAGDGPRCEEACRVEGACTPQGDRCLATSAEDCRASHLCGQFGHCSLGPAGTCVAASDADCADAMMCRWNGFCSAREGVCTTGLAVCEDPCRVLGWCGTRDAVCVPRDDADCAASLACLVSGTCGRSDGVREVCRPRDASDCARALEGQAYGRTELRGGRCVGPADPPGWAPTGACAWEPGCADVGRCLTAPDGSCHTPEEYGLPPIPPERRPRVRLPR